MKTSLHLRKLCLAAVLTAVCVATSTFSIPVGASRCFPIQHLCNILAGVFLGAMVQCRDGFLCQPSSQSDGFRNSARLPRQHGRGSAGRHTLPVLRTQTGACLPRRAGRNQHSGRYTCLAARQSLSSEKNLHCFPTYFHSSSAVAGGTIIAVFLVGALKKTGTLNRVLNPSVRKL